MSWAGNSLGMWCRADGHKSAQHSGRTRYLHHLVTRQWQTDSSKTSVICNRYYRYAWCSQIIRHLAGNWTYPDVSNVASLRLRFGRNAKRLAPSLQTVEYQGATPLRNIGIFNYPLLIGIGQKTKILNMNSVKSANLKKKKIQILKFVPVSQ